MQEKRKQTYWTWSKLKPLCIKGHYEQREKETHGWEKILAKNPVSEKELASKIHNNYKPTMQAKDLNLKMGKRVLPNCTLKKGSDAKFHLR